jgi:hypothetical protein
MSIGPATTKEELAAIVAQQLAKGFSFNGRIGSHPKCATVIDFNNPPIVVGEKHITDDLLITRKTKLGSFRLLSPLDSLLDRLASYIHFQDRQALAQAVMLFKDQQIDLEEVKRWIASEGTRTKGRADAYSAVLNAFLEAIDK